ncbi:MAG: sterol desaturase family protein, partial [Myxococcales bacterium]|nr:sterol desaturase family protein [Myxococcales bacterium]
MARPSDLAHSPRDNTLTITWEDGTVSVLPIPYLRAWCPCAGCQGHSNTIAHRPAGADMRAAKLWEVGAYALGRGALGIPEMPTTAWWTWVFALIALDFLYYWFHRWSHEVNFLWASHIVHHQSEEYNLTVALRQSAFQGLFSIWLYLPLALVGVPPLVYVFSSQINTIYQFWIHTRLVKRMGPLEWVLNTPSHHRVHHGADPLYLDRNYAGMLIVWDRWFGSFQEEREEPTYGTTKPLAHWNPLWANFDYWATLIREARSMPRLRDRLQIWFRH